MVDQDGGQANEHHDDDEGRRRRRRTGEEHKWTQKKRHWSGKERNWLLEADATAAFCCVFWVNDFFIYCILSLFS